MEARLPAHLEVSSLIRSVNAAGGFATVLSRGDREAGTLLVVIAPNGADARVYERMPMLDGTRQWHCSYRETPENRQEFSDYLQRRGSQDRDLWIVELDIVGGERFIGLPTNSG